MCIAVCEGEQACLKNEICMFPGVCRCPPGYYGAQCKKRELEGFINAHVFSCAIPLLNEP